jgi:hypothetical protein
MIGSIETGIFELDSARPRRTIGDNGQGLRIELKISSVGELSECQPR